MNQLRQSVFLDMGVGVTRVGVTGVAIAGCIMGGSIDGGETPWYV